MEPITSTKPFTAMKEIWKDIPSFEGYYQVSNHGRIKALARTTFDKNGKAYSRKEHVVKPSLTRTYYKVHLSKGNKLYYFSVHRLVALAFIPTDDTSKHIDHIDTNPLNNNVDNLRWVTISENCNNNLTRKHISLSKKGHSVSDATKAKISSILKGRKLSESTKAKMSLNRNRTIIYAFDLNGKFLHKFKSAKEAGQFANRHYTSVISCCKGRTKTCGNYIFSYNDRIQ